MRIIFRKNNFFKFLTNLGLFCFSISSGFLIVELVARKYLLDFKPPINIEYESHNGTLTGKRNSIQRLKNKANEYDINLEFNEAGFRSKYLPEEGDQETLYVVGDSFAWGFGVEYEKVFSTVLEKLSNRKVINISNPGDFNSYRRNVNYAIKRGAKINNLIVSICMENDLKFYSNKEIAKKILQKELEYLGLNKIKLKKHRIRYIKQAGWIENGKLNTFHQYLFDIKSFLNNSTLYLYFKQMAYQSPELISFLEKIGFVINHKNIINLESPFFFNQQVVDDSLKNLLKIYDKEKITILIVPSRSLWIGSKQKIDNAKKIHETFIKLIKDNDIKVVDPYPIMIREQNPDSYHFKYDGHWNNKGHELAAQELSKIFRK